MLVLNITSNFELKLCLGARFQRAFLFGAANSKAHLSGEIETKSAAIKSNLLRRATPSVNILEVGGGG